MNGNARAMPGTGSRNDFTGFYVAAGLEYFVSEDLMVGGSIYHSDLGGTTGLGNHTDGALWAGSIYARYAENKWVIDGQASITSIDLDTLRRVDFLGAQQVLESQDRNSGLAASLRLGRELGRSDFTVTPGIEARYASVSFDEVTEVGGPLALQIDREDLTSFQLRWGAEFEKRGKSSQIKGHVDYVYEFEDLQTLFGANFVGGRGTARGFQLASTDSNWFELGLSSEISSGPVSVGLGVEATIGRDSAEMQTYSGRLTYRF